MSGINWKDVAERAEWTFAQAFLSVVGVAAADVTSVATWKAAVIGGVAAVLSFLKNVAVQQNEANQP